MSRNASTTKLTIPSRTRMKFIPSFMLWMTEISVFSGVNFGLISSSVMTTATYETAFSPKHQVAPSLKSATPPNIGPITRATLN